MASITVSPQFEGMIQPLAVARNGQIVGATVENAMRNHANQVMAFRGKEHFSYSGAVDDIPTGTSGTRVRWRFAGRTTKWCARLHVRVVMARNDHVDAVDPHATFRETASGQLLEWHFGGNGGASDVPSEWAEFSGVMDVDPETDIYGVFTEINGGRLIAACVFEESNDPDTANGYLQAVSVGSNIYDTDRENLAGFVVGTWTSGGSHVWNACADTQAGAPTNTSTTFKNLFDTTLSTVSSSTPGATVDMTGKATLMRETSPGVGCVMKVYAHVAGPSPGKVKLYDSSGAVIATVDVTEADAYGWYATALYLPAISAKYDLRFAVNSGTDSSMKVHAVSIYEFEHGGATPDVPDPEADLSFTAVPVFTGSSTVAAFATKAFSVSVTTSGGAMTGASFRLYAQGYDGGAGPVNSISTTDLDGWTESGWTNDGTNFYNDFTKATLIDLYAGQIDLLLTANSGAPTLIDIFTYCAVPPTDQVATGTIGDIELTIDDGL